MFLEMAGGEGGLSNSGSAGDASATSGGSTNTNDRNFNYKGTQTTTAGIDLGNPVTMAMLIGGAIAIYMLTKKRR